MGQPSTSDYKQYRSEMIALGIEFQDFVQDLLYDHGLSIGAYSSKRYQYEKGENRAGVEIKFDQKWRETGNVYIEVAEKAQPREGDYAKSGIYRNDNSWLYVIGDRSCIFVFPKVTLRHLYEAMRETNKPRYKRVETPTSQGMLLPVEDARKFSAKVIEVDSKNET